jgi:hypothetical protein
VEPGARCLAANIPVFDFGEVLKRACLRRREPTQLFGQVSIQQHMAIELAYFKAKPKSVSCARNRAASLAKHA